MEKKYTQGIYIDGIYFDIPLISLKRNAEFLDRYAKRVRDGDLKRNLIGVYLNYTMSFGDIDDLDVYEQLWKKLTEPVEFHDFEVPDIQGTYTFRGYISSVSDEAKKIEENVSYFGNLACKFIAKKPARKR
jgi:hypothetical protein